MKMICVMEDGRIVQNEPMDAQEMSGILLNAVLNMLKYFVSIQETEEEKKAYWEKLNIDWVTKSSISLFNLWYERLGFEGLKVLDFVICFPEPSRPQEILIK